MGVHQPTASGEGQVAPAVTAQVAGGKQQPTSGETATSWQAASQPSARAAAAQASWLGLALAAGDAPPICTRSAVLINPYVQSGLRGGLGSWGI